jgi:hypothetical protein
MQKKIQIIGFIAGCMAIVIIAIQAGRHHANCRECKLSFSKTETESVKFAEAWK